MILLSQRDERWSNEKLGFSTDTTIGSHGCLITCLSMIWGSDPVKINDWLKNNNGYAGLNLVDWTSLPGFEWRGWIYEDDKVKETIKKYGCCIIETDFNINPKDGSHFVVAIGNGKIYDPWDGKEKAFGSYKIFYGYAIINPLKNPVREATMVSTPDWIIINSDNWIGILTYLEVTKKNPILDDAKNVVAGIKARANDMEKQRGQAEANLVTAQETISTINDRLLAETVKGKDLSSNLIKNEAKVKSLNGQLDGIIKEKGKLLEEVAELKAKRGFDEIMRPSFRGKKSNYSLIKYK